MQDFISFMLSDAKRETEEKRLHGFTPFAYPDFERGLSHWAIVVNFATKKGL